MRDQKELNHILRQGVIDALNDLGNPQHGDDIKAWILNQEKATPADWGMTPPNGKYPEGRYRFVLSFTLITNQMKKKGLIFSPARGYYSTDANVTMSAPAQAPKKTPKTPKSEAYTLPNNDPDVEELVEIFEANSVDPEQQKLADEQAIQNANDFGDFLDEVSQEDSDSEMQAPQSSQEEIERPQEEWAPVEIDLAPVEVVEATPVEEEEVISDSEMQSPIEVEASQEEIIAQDMTAQEEIIAQDYCPVEEEEVISDSEMQTPIEVEASSEEIEASSEEIEASSEEIEASQEEIEPSSEEIEASQEVIEASSESEMNISVDDDLLDGIFDDDKEALNLLLSRIQGSPLYGAIQEDNVYLSDDESVKVVFNQDAPSDWSFTNEKHKLIIEKAKSEGLTQYGKIVTKVSEKTAQMGFHDGSSPLGCFGTGNAYGDFCYSKCPLGALCKTSILQNNA